MPRIKREKVGSEKNAMAMMTLLIFEPSRLTSQMARIKPGKARIRSMTRMMALSAKPPKKPAIKPSGALTMTASPTDRKPTRNETRPP